MNNSGEEKFAQTEPFAAINDVDRLGEQAGLEMSDEEELGLKQELETRDEERLDLNSSDKTLTD